MRFVALLTLVIATVFLLTPSINNGFWSWLGAAPLFTKFVFLCLSFSTMTILVRCTWDIQAQKIQKRAWRNVAFIATVVTIGLVMLGMVLVATLTPVPDWVFSIAFVALLTAIFAWGHKNLSPHRDAVAG